MVKAKKTSTLFEMAGDPAAHCCQFGVISGMVEHKKRDHQVKLAEWFERAHIGQMVLNSRGLFRFCLPGQGNHGRRLVDPDHCSCPALLELPRVETFPAAQVEHPQPVQGTDLLLEGVGFCPAEGRVRVADEPLVLLGNLFVHGGSDAFIRCVQRYTVGCGWGALQQSGDGMLPAGAPHWPARRAG